IARFRLMHAIIDKNLVIRIVLATCNDVAKLQRFGRLQRRPEPKRRLAGTLVVLVLERLLFVGTVQLPYAQRNKCRHERGECEGGKPRGARTGRHGIGPMLCYAPAVEERDLPLIVYFSLASLPGAA